MMRGNLAVKMADFPPWIMPATSCPSAALSHAPPTLPPSSPTPAPHPSANGGPPVPHRRPAAEQAAGQPPGRAPALQQAVGGRSGCWQALAGAVGLAPASTGGASLPAPLPQPSPAPLQHLQGRHTARGLAGERGLAPGPLCCRRHRLRRAAIARLRWQPAADAVLPSPFPPHHPAACRGEPPPLLNCPSRLPPAHRRCCRPCSPAACLVRAWQGCTALWQRCRACRLGPAAAAAAAHNTPTSTTSGPCCRAGPPQDARGAAAHHAPGGEGGESGCRKLPLPAGAIMPPVDAAADPMGCRLTPRRRPLGGGAATAPPPLPALPPPAPPPRASALQSWTPCSPPWGRAAPQRARRPSCRRPCRPLACRCRSAARPAPRAATRARCRPRPRCRRRCWWRCAPPLRHLRP